MISVISVKRFMAIV